VYYFCSTKKTNHLGWLSAGGVNLKHKSGGKNQSSVLIVTTTTNGRLREYGREWGE
jgi:hypothetical protein